MISTYLQTPPKALHWDPGKVEALVHPWGDVSENDPDVIASKTYPDLLPFPNPSRNPDPLTWDPWKHAFHASSGLKPMDQVTKVLLQKKLEVGLYGLDPGEIIHLQLLNVLEMATIDLNRRFALVYPMLKDGKVVPFATEAKVQFGMSMKPDLAPQHILHEVEKAFVRLVQNAVCLGEYPPPPACPHDGCFDFARFKILDLQNLTVTVACQKHAPMLPEWNGPAVLTRTMKLWAAHKIRHRSQPVPTSQLSLDEVFA